MSPLQANVVIDGFTHTLSISVGKPKLGPTRSLNVYLQGPMPGILPIKVDEYIAVGLPNCYGVARGDDVQLAPIATCATLSECQAVALSDYISRYNLEIVHDREST